MGTGVVHDVSIIAAGWVAWRDSPITISISLGDLRFAWATMLIVGGVLSLVGIFIRQLRPELTGCVMTAAAKLVWAVAVVQLDTSPYGTGTFAFILIAGASGTMWRFFGLYIGSLLRARK